MPSTGYPLIEFVEQFYESVVISSPIERVGITLDAAEDASIVSISSSIIVLPTAFVHRLYFVDRLLIVAKLQRPARDSCLKIETVPLKVFCLSHVAFRIFHVLYGSLELMEMLTIAYREASIATQPPGLSSTAFGNAQLLVPRIQLLGLRGDLLASWSMQC